MKHSRRNRLLLLVAVVHLVADTVFAGDMVLCVGVNDHKAIEAVHLDTACPMTATNQRDRAGLRSIDTTPVDCSDQLVHAASAEMVSEHADGSQLEAPAVLLSSPRGETYAQASFPPGAASRSAPPALQSHRTIVLLI